MTKTHSKRKQKQIQKHFPSGSKIFGFEVINGRIEGFKIVDVCYSKQLEQWLPEVLVDPANFIDENDQLFKDSVNEVVREKGIDHGHVASLQQQIKENGQTKAGRAYILPNGEIVLCGGGHRSSAQKNLGNDVRLRLEPAPKNRRSAERTAFFDNCEEAKKPAGKSEAKTELESEIENPEFWKAAGTTFEKAAKDAEESRKAYDQIRTFVDPVDGTEKGKFFPLSEKETHTKIKNEWKQKALKTRGLEVHTPAAIAKAIKNMEVEDRGFAIPSGTWCGSVSGETKLKPTPESPCLDERTILHRVDGSSSLSGHLNSYMETREKFPYGWIGIIVQISNPGDKAGLIRQRYKTLLAYERKMSVHGKMQILGSEFEPYNGIFFVCQQKHGSWKNQNIPGVAEESTSRLLNRDDVRAAYRALLAYESKQKEALTSTQEPQQLVLNE